MSSRREEWYYPQGVAMVVELGPVEQVGPTRQRRRVKRIAFQFEPSTPPAVRAGWERTVGKEDYDERVYVADHRGRCRWGQWHPAIVQR